MNFFPKQKFLLFTYSLVLVSGLLGCGGDGELSKVVNINIGSRAAWNQWEDKGGLNGSGGNKLYGIEISGITAKYYKGEYGTGPAFVEMKTYATPEQMRSALGKVCNVDANSFVRLNNERANGESRFSRNGKDYICYYEASNAGNQSTMLLMSELSK